MFALFLNSFPEGGRKPNSMSLWMPIIQNLFLNSFPEGGRKLYKHGRHCVSHVPREFLNSFPEGGRKLSLWLKGGRFSSDQESF